jgi:hypothetical protein
MNAELLHKYSEAYEYQLKQLFGNFSIEKNRLLTLEQNTQSYTLSVNLRLESQDKFVLIFDLPITLNELKKRQNKILKRFSAIYTIANNSLSRDKKIQLLLHLPVEGFLQELKS